MNTTQEIERDYAIYMLVADIVDNHRPELENISADGWADLCNWRDKHKGTTLALMVKIALRPYGRVNFIHPERSDLPMNDVITKLVEIRAMPASFDKTAIKRIGVEKPISEHGLSELIDWVDASRHTYLGHLIAHILGVTQSTDWTRPVIALQFISEEGRNELVDWMNAAPRSGTASFAMFGKPIK